MLRMKKIVAFTLLGISSVLLAAPSHAGMVWFSRANCYNNESITWDWPGNYYWLWTNSHHLKNGQWEPVERTGWEYTWRSAAIHKGEGLQGGYYVVGNHFDWIAGYGEHWFGHTETNNCNLQYFFPYW